MASARATVAGDEIAVVAALAAGDPAVATRRHRGARLPRRRAAEARLGVTGAVAAVARRRVAVVADLRRLDDAVAAVHDLQAWRPGDDALVARLDLAVGTAAVVGGCVAVVANLAGGDLAITARIARFRRGVRRTRMPSTTREEPEYRQQRDPTHQGSDYAGRYQTQCLSRTPRSVSDH